MAGNEEPLVITVVAYLLLSANDVAFVGLAVQTTIEAAHIPGIPPQELPSTVVIDRQGQVAADVTGMR